MVYFGTVMKLLEVLRVTTAQTATLSTLACLLTQQQYTASADRQVTIQ